MLSLFQVPEDSDEVVVEEVLDENNGTETESGKSRHRRSAYGPSYGPGYYPSYYPHYGYGYGHGYGYYPYYYTPKHRSVSLYDLLHKNTAFKESFLGAKQHDDDFEPPIVVN